MCYGDACLPREACSSNKPHSRWCRSPSASGSAALAISPPHSVVMKDTHPPNFDGCTRRGVRNKPMRLHSTASLLMMAGANPAAVQRIMRHSDPKLTTEVYGHLAPEHLRAGVDRTTFVPS